MTRQLAATAAALLLALGLTAPATAVVPAHHCSLSGGQTFCDPAEDDLSPHWKPHDRLTGADRYETSVAIALYAQDPTVEYLIVTSGLGIDALTAGTWLDGRMLLVPHGSDTVPLAVLGAAAGINPDRVLFLGGEAAVSEAQAKAILDHIAFWNP